MHVSTKSNIHTVGAVPSFHPSHHSNMIGHLSGSNNSALNATKTSSFAAALRKLAKQAVDPVMEKDLISNTPASSPAGVSTSGTPNHMLTASYLSSNGPLASSISSPSITISPTPSQLALSLETRNRMNVSDLGHLVVESKVAQSEKRCDSYFRSSDNQVISHFRSESAKPVSDHPDVGCPSIRGFQPYRSVSDVSHSYPSLYSPCFLPLLPAPYPYHSAFLPSNHFSHMTYRLKESSYLDHSGIMRPPVLSFLPAPGMVSRSNMPFVPDRPYPPEILGNSLGLVSPGVSVLNCESFRHLQEEQLQELVEENKWDQERNCNWSRIRDQDIIQGQEVNRGLTENTEEMSSTSHSPLAASKNEPVGKHGSVTRGTPCNIVTKGSPQVTVTSPTPLNLTAYSTGLEVHNEISTCPEQDISEGLGYKHPLLLYQDIERNLPSSLQCSQATKELDRNLKKKAEKSIAKSMIEVQGSWSLGTKQLWTKPQNTTTDTHSNYNNIYDYSNKNIVDQNGTKKETFVNGHLKDDLLFDDLLFIKPNHTPCNEIDIKHMLSEEDTRCIDLKTYSEPNKTPDAQTLLSKRNYNHHHIPTRQSPTTVNSEQEIVCGVTIQNGSSSFHLTSVRDQNDMRDTVGNLSSTVVSKLDLQEKRLNKVRLDGTCQSDASDSDVEERNELGYLFLIKSGPPLKLDLNPKKLKFLEVFGLTTHQKKREKDLENLLKRRKLFHQQVFTPLLLEPQAPTTDLDEAGTNIKPDDFRKEETYSQKTEFLTVFRLLPTTPQKVNEVEKTWRTIKNEREKRTRKYWEREKRKRFMSAVSPQKKEETVGSINLGDRERNEETTLTFEPEGPLPSIQKPSYVQLHENTPFQKISSTGTLNNSSEEEPTHKAQRTRLCPRSCEDWLSEPPSMLKLNTSQLLTHNRESSNHADMDFVQQFHKSVLHATKLQLAEQKQFHCTEDNTRLKVYPDVTLSTTRANGEKSGELERTKKRHQKNFSWPGVEAVLERYEHHLAEQRSEKEFLSERCQELNLRNKQFNCQMKRMRQHLKKLLTLKHHLEEDRHHYQKTIDKLKKCLQQLR
ncbi:uncharacterized protein LOC143258629 isoform X3 [Tachypleus tridentatus]